MNGRKIFLILLLSLLAIVCFAFRVLGTNAWDIWNIPTLQPGFLDARIITAGAESYRLGFDPEIENPKDPNGRLFNLPAAWELFFFTGISQEQTNLFAGFLILSFYLGLVLLVYSLGKFTPWALALCAFSPPVALALERGNVDLFIFFLCALALIWLDKKPTLSVIILWIAGALKIYPVFGVFIFLQLERRTFQKYFIWFTTSFALYSLLTFNSFHHGLANTEVGFDVSYGVNVLPLYIEQIGKNDLFSIVSGILLFVMALLIVVLSFYGERRSNKSLAVINSSHLAAFRLGSGIYISTFLLGSNWDYRLMFLLFTLPQLGDWMKQSEVARYTFMAIVTTFAYLWIKRVLPLAYFLDEFANWLSFAGLFYLILLSLPEWGKSEIQMFFDRDKRKPA